MEKLTLKGNEMEIDKLIIEAAELLHDVCDGAKTKDGSGFSAGDVNIGWGLAGATDISDPRAVYAAAMIMRRYSKTQLTSEKWAPIWDYLNSYPLLSHSEKIKANYAEQEIRSAGKFKREEAKYLATRRFVFTPDHMGVTCEWEDPGRHEYVEKIKKLDCSWDKERRHWAVMYSRNTREQVAAVFDIDDKDLARFSSKVSNFAIKAGVGTGVMMGRLCAVIKTPAPWVNEKWPTITGMMFKDLLKKNHDFKYISSTKNWTGELTPAALDWLFSLGIDWDIDEETDRIIKAQRVTQNNAHPDPRLGETDLSTYKASNGWALRPYQIKGIEFIRQRRASMILDDMGSGKTCQLLMSINKGGCGIVVVPASLMSNWMREAALWRPDLEVVIGDLREDCRVYRNTLFLVSNAKLGKKSEKSSSILGVNGTGGKRSILSNVEGVDLLLGVDECKAFKNPESLRTGYLINFTQQVLALGGRVVGMDGTPITKNPCDLYVQQAVFSLAGVTWGGYGSFVEAYGGKFETGYTKKNRSPKASVEWGAYEPDQELITDCLQSTTLRRNKADLMPWLPPQRWTEHLITSDEVSASIERQIMSECDEVFGPETKENASKRIQFIEKLVDGHAGVGIQAGVMSRLRKLLALAKIKFVLPEVVAYIRSEGYKSNTRKPRLVVMTASAKAAKELHALLDKEDGIYPGLICGGVSQKERENIVTAFQNTSRERFNVIVATIGSAGQGINLFAADTMFFIDWDWSHAMNEQAEARTHRSGLESDKALYVNFMVDHWLDKAVATACGRKREYHETIKETAVSV